MKKEVDTLIKVNNVTKKFDEFTALNDITLDVKKGSIYGLVGPNGSGKTTLIKSIIGVYKTNSGEILIDDKIVFENNEIKKRIAYIPDDLFFFNVYSTKNMAKFYANIYPDFNWERYNKLKEYLKLDENKRISKFSKGMKRQVAFWLAICTNPDVMILDEPVDGLDPIMRKKILSLLMQDVAEREVTILISSHNLRELEDICDYVGIINDGKLLLQKELDSLKSDTHKIQTSFNKELDIANELDTLKITKTGSVISAVVKGDKQEIIDKLQKHNPLFIDFIPLTLEEIFIYEIGGDEDVQNIIL